MSTTVKITNVYADRQNTVTVTVESPKADLTGLVDEYDERLEDWWGDVVEPETGDGLGGDAGYFAEVLASDKPELIGLTYEWYG